MKLASVSIAVLSTHNNPLLLNHDFLERNGIVPADWVLKDFLAVPPLARIVYQNEIEFILEQQKLIIRSNDPARVDWVTEVPRMVVGFLAALPQVAYKAAGINFDAREPLVANESGRSTYIDMMIKDGPWLNFGDRASIEGVKLRYMLPDAILLNLSIDRVRTKEGAAEVEQIKFEGNFHHDFEEGQRDERRAYVNSVRHRYSEFLEVLNQFGARPP